MGVLTLPASLGYHISSMPSLHPADSIMRTLTFSFILFLPLSTQGAEPKPGDKPIATKDAAKAMTLPDGFKATLFAGEPDVVQPIAMAFDDRGRLWVVECLSYPNWRKDGKGNDRVLIFEDTKNIGTFDKRTVFLDNGSNLSGITLGFGGVWLCSSPNLLFIPIKDGEDKPAGPPQVVLDGWNMIDTKHNIFNSLVWGPDGWLYGCNGIQAKAWVGAPGTPKEKRAYIDCGVWRYHPTRKIVEAFAHGTTNPFGLDFDDYGELFITNCVIDHLFHFVPGGHYQRMYGQDANPNVYGLMGSCVKHRHWASGDWTSSRSTGPNGDPKHSDAGGGHAHSGCLVYLGDNFPSEYRNSVFMCNIHGNRLNRDRLTRTPSGYLGVREKDFLFANDSWFRGIALASGPDGGLYVTDWCDTGECHNYDRVDATNGRIYKVTYGTPKPWKGDISKLTDDELVKLQLHPNDWFVRHARRALQERAAAGKLEKETPTALRKMLKEEKDVARRLRALWALEVTDSLRLEERTALLSDPDEQVRAWAYRLGARDGGVILMMTYTIGREESPYVLASAASALQQVPPLGAWQVGEPLLAHRIVKADPYLSLLLWYGVERWYSQNPESAFISLPSMKNSLCRRNSVHLLLSMPNRENFLANLMTVIEKATEDEVRIDILHGIREALTGLKSVAPPKGWSEVYASLLKMENPEIKREAEAIAVLFGDKEVIAKLARLIVDVKAKADDRRAAIELLLPRKLPDFAKVLHGLLNDPEVRQIAIRDLASFADPETPVAILKAYPKFTPDEKADAVQTLAARVTWAKVLLDAIENGTIPRADVQVNTARQILALNDKTLSSRLEKVWGKIAPASKERVALTKKWKDYLTEETLAKADPGRGRALFVKNCAACHKMYGEGNAVGPELTGSQRSNLDYVLENVLDPSAVVPNEYRMINFVLVDDRVVSGIILRETKEALSVRTTNETVILSVSDIASRKQTNLSIMPDGLFDQMKPEEVRDLVAYLRSKEQVPIPK
jgi:putative membrane-bound dehydrogenase-like protein